MRLFVAIDFPEQVKRYLIDVGKKLDSDAADVAVAQQHHITLKFLGEYPENKVAELERKLSHIQFRQFRGKLGKVGTFGEGYQTKVVWGGIEPVEPFAKLAKDVDKATPDVKNDYSEYTPHITFARVKRVKALSAFLDLVNGLKLEPHEFFVPEFKLYRSIGGQEGHRYEVLRTFPAMP